MSDCKYCFGFGCGYCAEDTQAAANKAAEEGGLPERISQLIFDNTSLGWDKAIDLATAVLVFVDADRAAHPVGNNAEVDLPDYKIYAVINSMGWSLEDSAKDELFSLCKRVLRKVANKAEVEILIEALKDCARHPRLAQRENIVSKALAKVATPPATTGASTSPVETFIELRNRVAELEKQIREHPVGASTAFVPTVLTDERIENMWDAAFGSMDIPPAAYTFAREVAAQAGQVAVPGWISVDDGLPEFRHECTSSGCEVSDSLMVYGQNEFGTTGCGFGHARDDGTWSTYETEYYQLTVVKVTHWMPLPAAPSPAKESK